MSDGRSDGAVDYLDVLQGKAADILGLLEAADALCGPDGHNSVPVLIRLSRDMAHDLYQSLDSTRRPASTSTV